MVTLALDAGMPLRDVQDSARHADPRTTRRYDRDRHSLRRRVPGSPGAPYATATSGTPPSSLAGDEAAAIELGRGGADRQCGEVGAAMQNGALS
jgi:hypothetical protein